MKPEFVDLEVSPATERRLQILAAISGESVSKVASALIEIHAVLAVKEELERISAEDDSMAIIAGLEPPAAQEPQETPPRKSLPLHSLGLPLAARNALARAGLRTVEDFTGESAITADDLMALPRVGVACVDALGRALLALGIQLKEWPFKPKGPYVHRHRRSKCACGRSFYRTGMAHHKKSCPAVTR